MDKKLYFLNNGKPLCIWKQWDQDAVMKNLSTIFGEPFNKEFLTTPYDVMDQILNILSTKEFGIIDDVIFNLGLKYKFENDLIDETFIPEIYEGGYNSGYTDWWEGQQEVYLNWVCTIELVESLMANICLTCHLGNPSIAPYTAIFPKTDKE